MLLAVHHVALGQQVLTTPILATSYDSTIHGSGHHRVFTVKDKTIFYIIASIRKEKYVLRQLCIDELILIVKEIFMQVKPDAVKIFIKGK